MNPLWHHSTQRPITKRDTGRFVLGFGVAGWIAGYIEVLHGDYVVVDTGRNGGPLGGNVVADAMEKYTFVEITRA